MDGVGDYPIYFAFRDSFYGGSMKNLEDYPENFL